MRAVQHKCPPPPPRLYKHKATISFKNFVTNSKNDSEIIKKVLDLDQHSSGLNIFQNLDNYSKTKLKFEKKLSICL